jgi:hypothetical protein
LNTLPTLDGARRPSSGDPLPELPEPARVTGVALAPDADQSPAPVTADLPQLPPPVPPQPLPQAAAEPAPALAQAKPEAHVYPTSGPALEQPLPDLPAVTNAPVTASQALPEAPLQEGLQQALPGAEGVGQPSGLPEPPARLPELEFKQIQSLPESAAAEGRDGGIDRLVLAIGDAVRQVMAALPKSAPEARGPLTISSYTWPAR